MALKIIEETELPIILDDLPNFRLRNIDNDIIKAESSDPNEQYMEIGFKFIHELQKHLTNVKNQDQDTLYALYDYQFNKTCQTLFKDNAWPTPQDIEEKENIEIDINTQYLYKELIFRHSFARLQNNSFDTQIIMDSWENYTDIFDTIVNSRTELPMPVPWIWDIIDEFIYQFYVCCKWRRTISKDDQGLKHIMKRIEKNEDQSFWNLEQVIEIFKNLMKRSKIIQNIGKQNILNVFDKNTSLHYYGYFALVGLLRVYVLTGEFDNALQIIEPIDFKNLTVYSKAVYSYISLFVYAGFSYLMKQRYREAVKLFEAIVLFVHKYKTFLTKSFQFEALNKQQEKTLCLLALSLVFYPTQVDDQIHQLFKEVAIFSRDKKEYKEKLWDKFEKLNKFDNMTFLEVFNYGCPKIILTVKDMEDFKNLGDENISETLNKHRERLLSEFNNIQKLNNISSILKLYTNIPINKAAKLLQTSVEELRQYLVQYQERNKIKIKKGVPFEETILKRFLGEHSQINFEVKNEIINVTELAAKVNYTQYYAKMNIKVAELANELENFV